MQSPIATRNQVQADLDEIEEEVIDAIQEYRDTYHINDFKNYKSYYPDALLQNLPLNLDERRDNSFTFKAPRVASNTNEPT